MPKLKVNIVSFSTEDSVHTAQNILLNDTNKKWKCHSPGEKSANIILQLETPSKITGIDIGNEHSAYVEVLVSRTSNADEDFTVLLVMSSFMSPIESKQSTNTNKVRMFGYQELQTPERDQKWDRVKVVCTQPFNRHVQYGLSFITLHTTAKEENASESSGKIGNFLIRPKSPDNLSIGSLFARRKEFKDNTPQSAAAAIREASSSPNSVQKRPQCKPKLKDGKVPNNDVIIIGDTENAPKSRNRNELLYSTEENEPNAKIDKLIEDKIKESREKQLKKEEEEAKKKNSKKASKNNLDVASASTSTASPSSSKDKNKRDATKDSKDVNNKRKLNDTEMPQKKPKVDKRVYKPFHQLLNGVTIVISGIQNPERANIRSDALAMGAKYKGDWDNSCTHLICAFTNTPKFNQVKGKGKIINKNWIPTCYSERKRLPWRRFALDKKDHGKDESEDEIWEKREESPEVEMIYNRDDEDTEDEVEKTGVLQQVNSVTEKGCYSVETDEEDIETKSNNSVPNLPDFLANKVLYVDTELKDSTRNLLVRYITAFSGILVDDPSDIVDYAVSSSKSSDMLQVICPDAQVVSPDWIWECHNSKMLVAIDRYKL